MSGAQNLTIDGGDTLWVSDTGNGVVRNFNSGGTFKTLASGYTGVLGIAVDTFGQAYFDVPSSGKMYEIYDYGPVVQVSGTGSASCPVATPCTLSAQALGTPGEMSMDPYNHLFFVDGHQGAAFSTVQPIPANLIYLYDPFPYQQSPSAAMAVDAGDNLYSLWANGGVCEIVQQSLYNAENSNVSFTKVAGGHTCGFAGDGGIAGNAEIGNKVGQIAFDAAGDLLLHRYRQSACAPDRLHHRRHSHRSPETEPPAMAATAALRCSPISRTSHRGRGRLAGLGLHHQLRCSATGDPQDRSFGIHALRRSDQRHSERCTAMITITNTGNSTMTLTNSTISGANASDFKIDSASTTCLLTAGSCIAFRPDLQDWSLIFTPAAGGLAHG